MISMEDKKLPPLRPFSAWSTACKDPTVCSSPSPDSPQDGSPLSGRSPCQHFWYTTLLPSSLRTSDMPKASNRPFWHISKMTIDTWPHTELSYGSVSSLSLWSSSTCSSEKSTLCSDFDRIGMSSEFLCFWFWNYRKSNAALELIVDGNGSHRVSLVYYICDLGNYYSSIRTKHGPKFRVTLRYYRHFGCLSFDSWLFGSKYHQKSQKTWVPKCSKLDIRHRKFHLLALFDGQLRYISYNSSNCKQKTNHKSTSSHHWLLSSGSMAGHYHLNSLQRCFSNSNSEYAYRIDVKWYLLRIRFFQIFKVNLGSKITPR